MTNRIVPKYTFSSRAGAEEVGRAGGRYEALALVKPTGLCWSNALGHGTVCLVKKRTEARASQK